MKPEWRTTTVVQLCLGMRETQEYGALPILADALEDAGCDDEKMLGELRGRLPDVAAQRLTALIYSEESAEAVAWFADNCSLFNLNYQGLIEVARGAAEYGDFVTEYDSESWRDNYYEVQDKFWDSYELITGKNGVERNSPFNCSC